jgi:hypothetical protein
MTGEIFAEGGAGRSGGKGSGTPGSPSSFKTRASAAGWHDSHATLPVPLPHWNPAPAQHGSTSSPRT